MRRSLAITLSIFAIGASAPAAAASVTATLRDFRDDHIDFENKRGDDRGIVRDELGADRLPVYAGGNGTVTTHGRAAFDQWYRDVPGTNQRRLHTLELTPGPSGTYTFESDEFFPLDGQLYGNQGRVHNYHFTTEVHARFTYRGGERFEFDGDDDVFAFINGRLVIDLGGVHGEQSADVELDDVADRIGLVPGRVYALDLFHAERATTRSNFKLTTTLVLEDNSDGDGGRRGDDGGLDGGNDRGDNGADDGDNHGDSSGDDGPGDSGAGEILDPDGGASLPDADQDGVPDGCALEVEQGVVCPDGLYPDQDGDGVPDALDGDVPSPSRDDVDATTDAPDDESARAGSGCASSQPGPLGLFALLLAAWAARRGRP
jgi:fibro-slime domain-containing protein